VVLAFTVLVAIVDAATLSSASRSVRGAVVFVLVAAVLAAVDGAAFSASTVSALPPHPVRAIPNDKSAVNIASFFTCILLVLVIIVCMP
jgi:hypothetical protein